MVLFHVKAHVYFFFPGFGVNLCMCVCFFYFHGKPDVHFAPSVASCFSPMLILIGSFSLLAVSTSCRRTSITASLCLLVSMASHSDCAAGDLFYVKKQPSRTISYKEGGKKTHCSTNKLPLLAPDHVGNTKAQRGRD